jgi:hypothetical protein
MVQSDSRAAKERSSPKTMHPLDFKRIYWLVFGAWAQPFKGQGGPNVDPLLGELRAGARR